MAAASYDQLLKQVEALKMENSNLRQELEDNSNHLTKLETEASNMKEVLKQLQGSIEDEAMASSGQIDLLERLKELNLDSSNFPGVKLRSKMSLRSYGSREGSVSSRSGECSPVPMGSFPRRGFVNGSRENTDMTRRQLEYEARQIRVAMEEQLGTCQDMEKRAQ
ncbi:APC, partial [Cervus elaphus hippelaphus]